MQLILFMGLQASGKSTFYKERFFQTHMRINLDMLKTRHRESILFEACLQSKQPIVIDNTNVSRKERERYIHPARGLGFQVIGYGFHTLLQDAFQRNAARHGKQRIPDKGLWGTLGRLEEPSLQEGFDTLYRVHIEPSGGFSVAPWEEGMTLCTKEERNHAF
ncbi:MAG: ATP-binding protein [Myxococcales bacterium]|nr:ATP-binding protein [Myxococcales bacterium]